MRSRPNNPFRTLPLLLTIGALAVLPINAGCNIIGPAAILIAGPEKVPAAFTLDPKRTTVVFIDDPSSQLPGREARLAMGKRAEEELLSRKLVEDMIQSREVIAITRGEKRAELTTVASVGKALRADIVIYALVRQFTISSDGAQFIPEAVLDVKIVESSTGKRLFPPEGEEPGSYRVTMKEPLIQSGVPTSRSQRTIAEVGAAERAGLALARVFFDWERDSTASRREETER
ncbi:MAG: hypothetical protein K2X32_06375 [Phycisphaerales bacterium]|nr:hypothetical protein [Phycisphaerales bacterium]